MTAYKHTFRAKLWLYDGAGAWHFVTLPKALAAEIRFFAAGPRRGFGSVRVVANIGESSWRTSIFPSKNAGSYLLPVKGEIRRAERLEVGRMVKVTLAIEGREI
ncbi:MAG: DUF1905 domain-containing protein [Alphaproteobacteria bacterium]|nr:DUF1905 domain-containing protein [Alphaproteobacteria bacterium]